MTYWKISIVLLITAIIGCSGPKRLNEYDFAESYQANGLKYNYSTNVQSINDSITELHVKVDPNDFLFSKSEGEKHIARYTINYRVFKSYNDPTPLDTGNIHYSLREKNYSKKIEHVIKIYAPLGSDYIVEVGLYDENRDFKSAKILNLHKRTTTSRSFYHIEGTNKNTSVFQTDSFSITTTQDKAPTKLKVNQFTYNLTTAPSPQSVTYVLNYNVIADSSWTVDLNSTNRFKTPENGFYFFETNTTIKEGFSVFNVNQEFPKITSIQEAIRAMGYLIDKNSYANLIRSSTPKEDFENTWVKLAGNRERARNLIKSYYKEVTKANQLFSCHQPGWATDRGMIYIVYGAPRIVYRFDNKEIWIYGEENNLLSEQFEFNKINSPISDNIFELRRNINYKVSWNRMVNSWLEDRGY